MVGTGGFEPPTPCTPSMCATRLRHVPTQGTLIIAENGGEVWFFLGPLRPREISWSSSRTWRRASSAGPGWTAAGLPQPELLLDLPPGPGQGDALFRPEGSLIRRMISTSLLPEDLLARPGQPGLQEGELLFPGSRWSPASTLVRRLTSSRRRRACWSSCVGHGVLAPWGPNSVHISISAG